VITCSCGWLLWWTLTITPWRFGSTESTQQSAVHNITVSGDKVTAYREGEAVASYSRDAVVVQRNHSHRPLDPHLLVGPKLKLKRARIHIAEIKSLLDQYNEPDPYEVRQEQDPQSGEIVASLVVKNPIPIALSPIVGDAIHNVRCALDFLICDLARDNGKIPNENGGFPLSQNNAERFKPGRVSKKIEGVCLRAERLIDLIKASEKFYRPLHILNRLDNIDKHNSIVLVAAATIKVTAKVGVPGMFIGPDGNLRILGPGPDGVPYMFDAGTPSEFKRAFLSDEEVEIHRSPAGFNEDIEITIDVAFGQGQIIVGEPVFATLESLADLVERIIGIFERRAIKRKT
jgi:hypothetical protein